MSEAKYHDCGDKQEQILLIIHFACRLDVKLIHPYDRCLLSHNGTIPSSGDKKIVVRKEYQQQQLNLGPPTETPEVLSINAVTEDVPIAEPATELAIDV